MTCPEHVPSFTDEPSGLGICDHCGYLAPLDSDGFMPRHDPASFEDRGRAYHQSHVMHPPGVVADAVDRSTVVALQRAAIEART